MPIDIGATIRALRIERRMSQKELADMLNISQQAIHKYESNKARPGYETLSALADILNVPITFFLRPEELPPDVRESRDMFHMRQAVHDNPDMLALFGIARKCGPKELKQAIKIMKTLIGDDDDE